MSSRSVPPDPIETIRCGLHCAISEYDGCERLPDELKDAVAALDQIHQGRGAIPRGLSVEEIQEELARRAEVILEKITPAVQVCQPELEQMLNQSLGELESFEDWISERLEAKTERIGEPQGSSGQAVADGATRDIEGPSDPDGKQEAETLATGE